MLQITQPRKHELVKSETYIQWVQSGVSPPKHHPEKQIKKMMKFSKTLKFLFLSVSSQSVICLVLRCLNWACTIKHLRQELLSDRNKLECLPMTVTTS